jgi:uncharacterized protein with HEPN domain
MPKDDMVRLKHMLEAAEEAVSFVKGRKREDLDTDRLLKRGLQKSIEIIGEAAMNVSKEGQARFSDIPWKKVIGMRHRLTHAYMDTDLDILWNTAIDDLPPLIEALEAVVRKEDLK